MTKLDTLPLNHEQAKAHYGWRKEVSMGIPAIAERVFALRGQTYRGCGYHYGMERRLGVLLSRINDYSSPLLVHDPMVDEIAYEELIELVAKAEWSVDHGGADPEGPGGPWGPSAEDASSPHPQSPDTR